MTRKTSLNDAHRRAGARMVDFGGWDMPLNYGSQIEEHHAVRRGAGMFDVSHMTVVDLRGAGARPFLRKLVANSVDKLKAPGSCGPDSTDEKGEPLLMKDCKGEASPCRDVFDGMPQEPAPYDPAAQPPEPTPEPSEEDTEDQIATKE